MRATILTLLAGTVVWFAAPHARATQQRALDVELRFPLGLALAPNGTLYVSERRAHVVRRVDLATGITEIVAGTGVAGFSGDGGPATAARIRCPDAIDVDRHGNLYIADRCNERIRRVDARTGIITTVAGNGERGVSPDGPALESAMRGVFYVRVHSDTEILFTDTDSDRIRMLDLSTGTITTLAGSGERGFDGDGGPALEAKFARPHVALFARNGDLIIGDSFNQRIRRVDARSGIVRTIAGSGQTGVAADRTPALAADFAYFGEILELDNGDLLFTEWSNGRVVRLDRATGQIRVVAGTVDRAAPWRDGEDPLATRFGPLADMAIDGVGRLYVVAAHGGAVRRVDLRARVVETVLGRLQAPDDPEE